MEAVRAVELLKRLVSIRSVSGSEESIQSFIESWLEKRGFRTRRQYVDRKRFNLLYDSGSPYLISCHVDTVPPIGMENPFTPVEVDSRIYGRGSADVKGAIASLLTAVEIFRERYPDEELPVSLAFVVDEENNSALGSERIVELVKDKRCCLILEPVYGMVCTAQMGTLEFSLTVRGESAHASEFEKVENPIKLCFELVRRLESALSRPVNVIMVRGGSEHYTVPEECRMLLEVKVYEGESWQEVERRIVEVVEGTETGCRITYRREDAEEFLSFRCGEFLRLVEEVHEAALGERPLRGVMPSWTDAANYHRAGLSCLIFGYGSLKESHTPREHISVSDLERMTRFFTALFERLR